MSLPCDAAHPAFVGAVTDACRSMFAASIMRIVYGLDVADEDDQYIQTAEEAIGGFNLAFLPGKYIAETFPIMRFIPQWFPGARFRRDAAGWRPAVLSMRNSPWEGALKTIVSKSQSSLTRVSLICSQREGKAKPSMVTALKDRLETDEDEDNAKDAAASVYLGESSTHLIHCSMMTRQHPLLQVLRTR